MSGSSTPRDRSAGLEVASRRPGFVGGEPIILADGQAWSFPGPGELAEEGPEREEVAAILLAIAECEDEAERLRGELVLAVRLLRVNYGLSPAAFREILEFRPGDPGLAASQAAFRGLARRHAEALRPCREPPSALRGTPFGLAFARRGRARDPGRAGRVG